MATTGYAIPSGSNVQPIIDMLEDTLNRHTNWSKVATVSSPGGMPCSVWKCSGAANSIGQDWYLLIARTTASPNTFHLGVAEGFNTSTQKVSRPVPGTGNSLVVPSADGSYLGGDEISIWGASGSVLNTVDIRFQDITSSAAAQSYCVVSKSWIAAPFFTAPTTSTMFWAGTVPFFFDSAKFTAVNSYNTGETAAYLSRHYKLTTRNANAWRACAPGNAWTPMAGTINGSGDRFFDNLPVGARCRLSIGATEGTQDYVTGKIIGLYPDMYRFNMSSDMYYGDTVTINGKKYLYCGNGYSLVNTDAP